MSTEEAIAAIRAIHHPSTDGPFSLIDYTYCACGAFANRIDSEGEAVISPVEYDQCPTVVVLSLLDLSHHDATGA